MMPAAEPDGGWDDLMRVVRRLNFRRRLSGWTDTAAFCSTLDPVLPSKVDIVQKRWSSTKDGKARAKELGSEFDHLNGGQVAELLTRWREHRYPIVMRFLLRAAQEFTRQRHSAGTLGFEDLLLLTAKLLREHPGTRDELGARYAHLLIDEFQDTDPVQAEVCFLLASPSSEGNDWHAVTPRPGSLFVVGDPKQSIFRFRRADIQVYEFVRRRMEASGGCILSLTANFRSNDAIREFVNNHFSGVFPGTSTPQQAAFAPMETRSPALGGEGVFSHSVQYEGAGNQQLLSLDATRTATWISERISRAERTAGDFLVLTPNTHQIERYARALSERNVATSTVGAPLTQEHELQELIVVLGAIADPENPIAVAAALEGLFFGLSPADLWSAKQASLRFAITHAPSDPEHQVGRALMRLHEWWRTSQRQPADVLMERILDDTGLLLHAASQTLGDARAGALLHLVETLRLSSVNGANGISDAMERLSLMLDSESPDAPLRPGRRDAVRVMNLHKAKGLEATVVILAAPVDETIHEPTCHIVRSDDGRATGSLALVFKDRNARRLLGPTTGLG
jgi:ATP-dependent helicase/nuclease subunit A